MSAAPSAESEPDREGEGSVRWGRRVRTALVVGAMILLPLGTRAWWEGEGEQRKAAAAREAGDTAGEILHLGRAARWVLPLTEQDEEARAQLLRLGRSLEEMGRDEEALVAYRELRRAILGTRSWKLVDPESFEVANRRIAALMAQREKVERGSKRVSEGREAAVFRQLDRIPGPDPSIALPAALAFVAWLASLVLFIRRGLDAQGRLRWKRARWWGCLVFALLLTWMALMRGGCSP